MTFTKDYYRSGNYVDYLERGPRYVQMAHELRVLFTQLSLCERDDAILDFGCGVGFLAKALIDAGFQKVFGSEKSKWASVTAKASGVTMLSTLKPCQVMLALDVFEHMTDAEVSAAIKSAKPKVLIVRIPVAETSRTFHLACSRRDPTHINCKKRDGWLRLFRFCGMGCAVKLKLYTIYDSPGVACFLLLRK